MAGVLTIQQLEEAINFYRGNSPAAGLSLSRETRTLANLYGLMIFHRVSEVKWSGLSIELTALLAGAGKVASEQGSINNVK